MVDLEDGMKLDWGTRTSVAPAHLTFRSALGAVEPGNTAQHLTFTEGQNLKKSDCFNQPSVLRLALNS